MSGIDTRFDFFGTFINATNLDEVVDFLTAYDYKKTGYISFPDSSVIATAQRDEDLRSILNSSLLTLPDGKPSEFYARMKGYKNVSTVSGYWLCKRLFQTNLTHYFLGSTEDKLAKIVHLMEKDFPDASIIGYHSPSFHDIQYFKEGNILTDAIEEINRLKPDLIWVGISSPKQDFLMRSHTPMVKQGILVGVGGVFDYLSGDVQKSPEWLKKIGMRWAWRLAKEPGRLGAKYWFTIKVFSALIVKKIFKV